MPRPRARTTRLGRRTRAGAATSVSPAARGEWASRPRHPLVSAQTWTLRVAWISYPDEPTSALYAEADYEVYRRFGELTEGRIVVLISHRFSRVRMADRIVVLSGGKLIELGSHAELMALDGAYARLVNLQAQVYP